MSPSRVSPSVDRSTSWATAMRYSAMDFVASKMRSVTFSGAGPPFGVLYLRPKSASSPPGLCEADRIRPPSVPLCRIRFRSEEHTSELQSRQYLVCRLLLEKKKNKHKTI